MPKVGVAQVGSVLFDTAGTLAKLQEFVERAQAAGVEFLVFPEAFVGGYPKGCRSVRSSGPAPRPVETSTCGTTRRR